MEVNGFIIKQAREDAGLPRDTFTTICSSADLEQIEAKNEGTLEIILDICAKLEIPYHQVFPETILSTEISLLNIVRCLHLRQEFSSVLFLLDTYGKKITYDNARIVGHLMYFRAYANLFGIRDTQKAVHYFQRAYTFLHDEKRYELLVLKGLATCYQANEEKKRARIFFERAEQLEEKMNTQLQLGPSYYQAACFYADRGNQEKANALCDEGIQTLLEVNMITGLEDLFFEKAVIQENMKEQIELLKQADYYANLNDNRTLKELINQKLTSI
ncbi:hypothetical protein [Candidatus Enterococcus murrayae]|uniref:Uncharacterized protein n=1 Tax=Candidatus Enterococcus murrayae TaxID=2815321 RepID=A0ABS3HMC7_9ENTE|nr:hypothetical protein [Enterococcus sp. MJM16]MBO0454142.1 hypothetical protein [Enterococcus sp. MJM16]